MSGSSASSGRPPDPLRTAPTLPPGSADPRADTLSPEEARAEEGPDRIGPYRILAEIGAGGMAIVYRARHEGIQRDVALKVLRRAYQHHGPTLHRFQLEAQTAAALAEHPGIVAARDVGEADGRAYVAFDLIEGETLEAVADRGDLSVADAARMVAEAARAVDHAHRQGILHRDIKPGNLLVTAAGEVRLADFGLAKAAASAPAATVLTRDGAVVGTPGYMSPEQARGQPLDVRTDVHALGATLWHALVGESPFRADSVERVLALVMEHEPPPPSRRNAQVPRALDAVVLRCLAKAPEARYPTAGALADDLERFLRGEVVQARLPGLWARCRRSAARNPRVTAFGAVAGLAVAALGATLLVGAWSARADRAAELRLASALTASDPEQALGILRRLAVRDPDQGGLSAAITAAERRAAARRDELLRASIALPLDKARRARTALQRTLDELAALPPAPVGLAAAFGAAAKLSGNQLFAGFGVDLATERRRDGLVVEGERWYTLAWDGFDTVRERLANHPDWPESREALDALLALVTERLLAAETLADAPRAERCLSALRTLPADRAAPWLSGEGSLTLTTDPPEARVELCRYVDVDGLRELELVRDLGRTPLTRVPLPMGAHHLVIRSAGCPAVHLPVHIARAEHEVTPTVPLLTADEIGPGYVYIPPGEAVIGGDAIAESGMPRDVRRLDGYCMGRTEVTVGEYAAYLRARLARGDDPAAVQAASTDLVELGDGRGRQFRHAPLWVVAGGELRLQEPVPPDWPVFGANYRHATDYCAWRSEIEGRTVRLPTEAEWERAGRGVDERAFAWGPAFRAGRALVGRPASGRVPALAPVGSTAGDVSIFGVHDLVGSMTEWTAGEQIGMPGASRALRGGRWDAPDEASVRLCYRSFGSAKSRLGRFGFRVVAEPVRR